MDASARTQVTDVMTLERLADFGAAWRAGDVDRLMSFMTGDCVFRAPSAPGRAQSFRAGMSYAVALS